ncbi:4-hydroxybutyrate dehydrogenase [[Clostridium] hylemonae]|uniref:4-hydroxybutyrate dehydrogenase n=1 Tax=[Clostridium] hylemonae TaxID=89153 RepID=UPI001106A73E|nr:4-hydroxybutyrate dehydrogenase [[Clostridium] hylemonae]
MKLFQQKSRIQQFDLAEDFVKEYGIGEGDFILASRTIYDKYFGPLGLNACVKYKDDYGKGEPTDSMMEALLRDFRSSGCERIAAIGGGAVIDMAKILVLDGAYSVKDIFEKKAVFKKKYPLIAVPTTCGAGSEVSNVSITEMTELNSKLGLAADELYADDAVLIPQLLSELPYSFWATSAIDAFIHAIESYVSPKANLYTEMFSIKAMEMIIHGFRSVIENGPDRRMELMEEFLTASNLAGIAFGNAGTGAVHAMSYPLSGVYHVTHGEANYQFLIAVFCAYQRFRPEGKLKRLNECLAGMLGCKAGEVYTELKNVLDKIIERKRLREYGMKREEIESFAKSVETSQQRLLDQSYVKFSWEQMAEIYSQLY